LTSVSAKHVVIFALRKQALKLPSRTRKKKMGQIIMTSSF